MPLAGGFLPLRPELRRMDVALEVRIDLRHHRYIGQRLNGFEPTEAGARVVGAVGGREAEAFPEYYEQYFREAMLGGMIMPLVPLICTGPVKYTHLEALEGTGLAGVYRAFIAAAGRERA